MIFKKILLIFVFTILLNNGNSARILGIFHVPSKSHHILASKLLKSLAEKGHEVTMISPYPFKNKIKNYRDIFIEEMLKFKEDNLQNVMKPHNISILEQISIFMNLFNTMNDIVLSHKQVQQLKSEKFDLVIQFALFSESFLGLANYWNAPVIFFNTLGSMPSLDRIIGNTSPPSYVSAVNPFFAATDEMTFLQRVVNTLNVWIYYGITSHLLDAKQQVILSKHFPNAPPLQELINNVSLIFVNSHYSIESPRPYVPNLIPVGGLHVDEPKELPLELKQFLDEAQNGAIFFSLGSNVKISSLPSEKLEAILNVLGRLKMKVLFKTDENLKNLPENIKIGKWLPQNDILAHKNLKLFISHGGLLSTIEAVYHGVPIIGIPIFGDQQKNIDEAVMKGFAVKVDLSELNEQIFSTAIIEILNNSKYRENIQYRSSLLKDDFIKPIDKAIYWVEHVLKYKGAPHLQNNSRKLNLLQYLLIDVIAFILAVLFFVTFFVYKICKIFICLCKKLLEIRRKIKKD